MIKEKLHRCNSGVRKKGYPAPAGFGSKKAVKKKLFVVLLSFVVTLSFVFQPNSNEVYAQNNTVNSERWMTTSGEYDFPISREKGNWDQVCTYN
ncbi:MAG: hypothetical protein J5943_11145, partial [Oribacterium sp.]|nr:hypothetical protein [Oribacterium sp.]